MHNKKPVQRILSLCLAIAIVLGIAIGTIVPAFAAPTKDMMVTDNAGMLTAEQESEIEDNDNSSGGWGFFDIFSDDDSGSWGGGSSGGGGASGGW